MKRTTPIVLLLALAMLLLCCACGGKTAPEISAVAPEATPEVTEPPKDTPAQIAEKMEAALEKLPAATQNLS